MKSVPLLSSFYFGSVEHYRLLAQYPTVMIDAGEHYERQSYRTRTSIVGPNGKQDLVVQIARRSGEKMPMKNVGLSYTETWAQQHLHAIRSAYGQTPWFIHYITDIESVLLKKYDRLVDLNMATLTLGLRWLRLNTEVIGSDAYIEQVDDKMDLRSSLHPKRPLPDGVSEVKPYPQVFEERHGFVPRMSIIDLVCNCGPEAVRHIRTST
ncbi:MAG TPA: WbqC family protein [Flavobacteriales bacterium]|nr:WbqC family protein [Flavobacteriales bacterium]